MVTRHVKDKNKGGWFSMSIDLDVQIPFPLFFRYEKLHLYNEKVVDHPTPRLVERGA